MYRTIPPIVKWEILSREFFSNELFDAFPVEIIEKRNGMLYEVRITYTEEGNLSEVCRPLDKRIGRYLLKYNIHIAEGQRFEVPIVMEEYIKEIAKWFQKVYVLQLITDTQKKNGCIQHTVKEVCEGIISIS